MNDKQIDRAIAQACWWTQISDDGMVGKAPGETANRVSFVPLYCNDLNAMHEAEKVLTEINWFTYISELAQIVRLPKQAEVQIKQSIHATARQRAEAFLRTLGKWEEVQT